MGLRFYKKVKLIPGVKLNISKSGVSVSVGVPGASVTTGKKGTYLNAGLPGTGLSYRMRIDGVSKPVNPPSNSNVELFSKANSVLSKPASKILKSLSIDELTSESMRGLKNEIDNVQRERSNICAEQMSAKRRRDRLQADLRRITRNPFRRLFQKIQLEQIKLDIEKSEIQANILSNRLSDTMLTFAFDLDEQIESAFETLDLAFEALTYVSHAWSIHSFNFVDQYQTRSSADAKVDRKKGTIRSKSPEFVKTQWTPLHFRGSGDVCVCILPSFILFENMARSYAVADVLELQVRFRPFQFIEESLLPDDAEVIGHTWLHVNKDGGPDRRFSHNPKLPIVEYGIISFRTDTGFREEFMISDITAAQRFVNVFNSYKSLLSTATLDVAIKDTQNG